jgi:NAD(P)-dependent dehydrogenase (short-subunit alcohol dehydrogenase family)
VSLALDGKAFVVCEGGRELGRAVARELLAGGARVLLAGPSTEDLEQATAELGTDAFALPCDLARPEEADRLAATVPLTLGRLDGVLVQEGDVAAGEALELEDEDWIEAFDVLIGRPVRLARRLAPLLGGEGALLLVSPRRIEPGAGLAVVNVLRPGVEALVTVLARELAPTIRVNGLAPGRADGGFPDTGDTGPGAPGDGESLARRAAFLLSPASTVTGATVYADGTAPSGAA